MDAKTLDYVTYLRGLDKDNQLALCSQLIPVIHQLGLQHGIKLFDNYNFRSQAMASVVRKELWHDMEVSTKRTGKDAWSKEHKLDDIEFKTEGNDKGKDALKTTFKWDKQEDPTRRTETLNSNAFVLGRFELESLRCLLAVSEEKAMTHAKALLKAKQEAFLKKWTANREKGKRGFDGVMVNYAELFEATDATWDFWIDGIWHRNATSAQCIDLLKNMKRAKVELKPKAKPEPEKPVADSLGMAVPTCRSCDGSHWTLACPEAPKALKSNGKRKRKPNAKAPQPSTGSTD